MGRKENLSVSPVTKQLASGLLILSRVSAALRRKVGRSVGTGELGHVLVDVGLCLALHVLVDLKVLEVSAVLQLFVEHRVSQLRPNVHRNTSICYGSSHASSETTGCAHRRWGRSEEKACRMPGKFFRKYRC